MSLAPFGSRQRSAGGRLMPRYGWDTRREIEDMSHRFNQLMSEFFGGSATLGRAGTWSALVPVDIEETDNAYVVDVDLPNVDPKDIDIEMRGEELRISGSFEQRQRSGIMRRQERQAGDFEYEVDLPSGIDPDQVSAIYQKGVLTVSVAKAKQSIPRKIDVHTQGDRPN